MKYARIYRVLENSHAKIYDRSPWRESPNSYLASYRPLWIILEDDRLHLRVWVTHEFGKLTVTTADMSLHCDSRAYHESMQRHRFLKQADMAQFLDALLNGEAGSNEGGIGKCSTLTSAKTFPAA